MNVNVHPRVRNNQGVKTRNKMAFLQINNTHAKSQTFEMENQLQGKMQKSI